MQYLNTFVSLSAEMAPYLVFGFLAAGLVHVFFPKDLIKKHLGRGGFRQSLKASLIGVPLPLCSCGVIPLARELKNSGSSHSSIAAFMASTPQVGLYSIIVTWGLMGWIFAMLRVISAFCAGVLAGSTVSLMEKRVSLDHEEPRNPIQTTRSKRTFKLSKSLSYGLFELPDSIRNSLITGLALAALISLVLPDYHAMVTRESLLLSYLAVIALAIPLYVCSTGSIPIALALLSSGFSPGSAMIFLVAGPATSMVTLMTMKSIVGIRHTTVYTLSVIAIAVLCAWVIDSTKLAVMLPSSDIHSHTTPIHWFQWFCLVVLVAGMFYQPLASLMRRWRNLKPNMNTLQSFEIKVDGMSCSKCAAAVTRLIEALPEHRAVEINLETKTVVFEAPALDRKTLRQVLETEDFAIID